MKRKRSRGWVGLNAPRWVGHHVIRNGDGAMMKQFMRALLCLCLLLPLGAKAEIFGFGIGATADPFTDVFVFGDSLSDTGNAAAFGDVPLLPLGFPIGTVGLCNPVDILPFPPGKGCGDLFFRQSRVSNGPVAVETLAKLLEGADLLDSEALEKVRQPSLHLFPLIVELIPFRPDNFGTNYAVAGARARARIDPPVSPVALAAVTSALGDLNVQIAGFLADPPSAPSDALYVLLIGGNDVRDAGGALLVALLGLSSAESSKDIIADAVDEIGRSIDLLIGEAGARKFLVVNSPNIGSIPLGFPRVESGLVRAVATFVTIKFNHQLAERLGQIQAEQQELGVEIKQFNLFRFFEGVRFFGKLFGVFENIKDPCFDSDTYLRSPIAERKFHSDCAPDPGELPKFDRFVFFDAIHPTGRVHAIVGNALSKAAGELVDD